MVQDRRRQHQAWGRSMPDLKSVHKEQLATIIYNFILTSLYLIVTRKKYFSICLPSFQFEHTMYRGQKFNNYLGK